MAKRILEQMYRGEFAPHEYVGMGDGELPRMRRKVDALTTAFTDRLDDSLREAFEQLERERSRMAFREGMLAYSSGFCCGMQLAFETIHSAP